MEIEAAMERIRVLAMAMNSSEDLAKTVNAFFTELHLLGGVPRRCGVGFIDKKTRVATLKATSSTEENDVKMIDGQLTLAGHPVLDNIYQGWIQQKEYRPVLRGNEIREYYKAMNPEVHFPEFEKDEVQYGYYFYFKEGGVYAWTEKELTESDLRLYRKFTDVLSLAHRRYNDLRQAELRAKEAIKQASLDRVRGQIASMRSTDDLGQITPLIWNELNNLGVSFSRCGVFIIDQDNPNVRVFLSTPDGRSLGMMNLPKDANELTIHAVTSWENNQVYTTHWNKEQFLAWVQSMFDEGYIEDKDSYQDSRAAPDSLHLQFVPFKQGMLYVGNASALSSEEMDLVKSLAESFSIAYARYEDFKRLEEAKLKVESALSELKATQSQLIQSEKMASLGELTAGIAHEIQNPLNFVNNFSEVSQELMDEMKEAFANKDYEEVKSILEDVIANLDKISHHGKRADGIVKGMLQHSRKGSGQKEPVDLNTLADEYLRLAFHGMRAKDKSFHVELVTAFEDTLPKVNIIAQDIGRVILNLITNAFYAVSERSKHQEEGYKPIVTVETKALKNDVQISVRDNGPGIPEHIIDKIFQPFFTTKPTGQGTGLGLSLSYDIIQSHGGELKVVSKTSEGSVFTITLPVA